MPMTTNLTNAQVSPEDTNSYHTQSFTNAVYEDIDDVTSPNETVRQVSNQ